MKNLKKRMAAICMALLVSTSMLPLDAFAAEYTGSTESATEVTTDVPVSGDTEQPATEGAGRHGTAGNRGAGRHGTADRGTGGHRTGRRIGRSCI
ncbi:MAG: hypothetical protein V8S31_12090 [Lachnospiraceae bacterium]